MVFPFEAMARLVDGISAPRMGADVNDAETSWQTKVGDGPGGPGELRRRGQGPDNRLWNISDLDQGRAKVGALR